MAQRARTDEFYDFIKSGKRSIFVIDSYLNDNALDAMFYTRYVKEVPFVNRSYMKGVLFS